jgi:hypothetical protein
MDKKLGYYTCHGHEFESKIQAMIVGQLYKSPVQWHFNNEVFDTHAWHVEPELTLDQLYDRRAREIREQYDYVILSYSGGSDSNNIVESFVRQGLHLDEIITNWALDAADKYIVRDPAERSTWNNIAEFHLHTKERLQWIQDRMPMTKITINDTSRTIVDSFLTAGDASWVKNKKEVLNANGTNAYNYVYFSETRKMFDKGKKIAVILGLDKPKLKIVNKKLYLYFTDKVANIASTQDHLAEYPNARTILFYWSPDSVDMLTKQAHTVLKLVNSDEKYKNIFENQDQDYTRQVHEEILKNLIYSTWNPKWFQVVKSTRDWDNELDYWFSRGWAGTREHDIWQAGIAHVAKSLGNNVALNPDGTIRGTKIIFSKLHYIGDVREF